MIHSKNNTENVFHFERMNFERLWKLVAGDKDSVPVTEMKQKIKAGDIEIRPFNCNKWSRYSFKKSKYILSPKYKYDESMKNSFSNNDLDSELETDPRKLDPNNISDINLNIGDNENNQSNNKNIPDERELVACEDKNVL